ncbi:MAG: pilus assembly protein [Gammaproteobacteria bacterium]
MNKRFSRQLISGACLAAGLATALCAGPAFADDTELFVTGFDAPASCNVPNVLFAIDTSGSMADPVLTQVPWNPDETFGGCYESDALYYSRTGEAPDCDSIDRFPKVDNFCAASTARLELVGRYKNLFRGWEEERQRWSQLELLTDPESTVVNFPVECEADRGVDGDGSNGALFASDGTPAPWQATQNSEPAWASASNVTIFDGNWLNWNTSAPTVERPRLDVVQDVTNQVIDSMDNMNVAIMKFNFEEGGPVVQAMAALDTAREEIKAVVNSLNPDGTTPLSETLYEAGQYFAGRLVDYGNVGPDLSVPASRLGGTTGGTTYNSPIGDADQKSYIIMLSDGLPNRDSSADGKITSLPGFAGLVGPDCDGDGEGRCLDDMAEYLFEADLRATIDGKQNVITHTIGFTQEIPILQTTAQRGGGRYFQANNSAALTTALTDLAESFEEDGGLFVAPTIPVNAFNQAQSLGDVFVSVFEPTNTVRWPGNLKKYGIRVDQDEDDITGETVEVNLIDFNNQIAIDPTTGTFAADSRSFWSDDTDGNDPTLGGAASQLPLPDDRILVTNLVSGDLIDPDGNNAVTGVNEDITPALLGSPAADRDAVIEWARGADAADVDEDDDRTEPRLAMGDPLHSRPVSVIYSGTEDAPDSTVFIGTNEGYLHAINASTGEELWSFIPRRLLQRLFALYTNNESATRLYGLDGEITLTILNNDGAPGISGAERVILIMGMRRGGESVFALDVTNRDRPELLWEIDPGTPGFASLGQTWSKPAITTVRIGTTDERVAIFGGGYDTGQDNRSYREDNVGNAIFMVRISDGTLLWSAGRSTDHDLPLDRMRFSIPAELTLLDVDGDGRTDRLYFGDMAAQLWRIDLINGNDRDTLGQGGALASLGGFESAPTPPAAEIRRFFNAPDVVPVITNERIYIAINIGSGYRAHPLDVDVEDQFFSVRDFQVFEPIATADYPETPLIIDDLLDVTNNGAPLIDPEDAGWRFGMVLGAGGEKVLSEATTFANTVFFTSFTPTNLGDACEPAGGQNRLYQVSILDGSSDNNRDQPADDFEPADRTIDLEQGGIAPEPVFFFPDGRPAILVGTEQPVQDPPGQGLIRTFWLQQEGF